ncbi:ABC transporter permease [Papillibacter cinnamivorans]|uniref:ABC-type transport system involved in multi-copper enzyme maturation, permease component n=1 Tax=Papillibacter cinnamivorans DSM 12816 TaxID=1122930 RepID=A0A1W2CNK3_9FIRM|nr:ABC transporter permease subunit [Papillibacter cinnamivorans]SMC86825.1 ABC-type transport system involved in multi-copper enzyme maturation, permease component [Papillibacter cinnamivorans DSM 12816]
MIPIASAAWKEAVRKKTFIVMSIVTVLYLVLWAILLYYFQNLGPGSKNESFRALAEVMVSQMGLQFSSMLMCLLTIILGAGTIASELESGMVHAILSRPLGRTEYVLGKTLGLAALTALYTTALYTALLLISGAFALSTITTLTFVQILEGWILYLLVPLCVLCLTIFGSVSLKVVPNGLLMIFIYLLGNLGGMVEMIGNYLNSRSVVSSGIFISLISPFHTLYTAAERALLPSSGLAGEMMRGMGGLTGGGRPASTVMYVYIALYSIGFLALAIRKFGRIDIN